MIKLALASALLFSLNQPLAAVLPSLPDLVTKNLNIQLESPVYENGVTSTDKGGIVTGKDLYIQAKKMKYTRRQEGDKLVRKLEAEGDLFFRFKNRVYIGDKAEFDLDNQTAIIYNVLTETGPWFLGGRKLFLQSDGSSVVDDCYLTNDESDQNDWTIQAKQVHLSKNNTLKAHNVRFMVLKKPVFWLPTLSKDLNKESSSPLKYSASYYSKNNVRLGVTYTYDGAENWEHRLLFDVSTLRGVAGGYETKYKNPDSNEAFNAFNYYAHDIATNDSDRMNRYRFQGKYINDYFDEKVHLRASYDKISDSSFPSDFTNRGLDSGRVGPTEARFIRKETNWMSTLNTKVRINEFQTVKQQLPLFTVNWRPMQILESPWVLDNRLNVGYLNYLYGKETPDVHNFHSARGALSQSVYRSYGLDFLTVTPQLGYKAIAYGNSPEHDAKFLAQGIFGLECHTRFNRVTPNTREALEPYAHYEYISKPSVNPHRHYLFDLQDGLFRQNSIRFGARHFLTYNAKRKLPSQLNLDLYTRLFLNSPNIGSHIPRLYLDGTWKATPYTKYTLGSAWDTQRHNLDHINVRTDVTFTESIAMALEYRHRNAFSWRKVDQSNFMLDTFRSQHELRHSEVSDRRDTFLTHFFVRLHPRLAVEFETRHGWRREHHRPYNEYEINVLTVIQRALKFTFTFRHRATGNDYGIDFSLGSSPPNINTNFKKLGQGNYDN